MVLLNCEWENLFPWTNGKQTQKHIQTCLEFFKPVKNVPKLLRWKAKKCYNINVNCVNLKVFSEYFLINWIYLAIFNVLGRTSHFSLLMILGLKFCRQAHRYQGRRLLRIIYRTITSSWRPPPSNWNAPHVSWPWGVWKRLWTGYHPLPRDG